MKLPVYIKDKEEVQLIDVSMLGEYVTIGTKNGLPLMIEKIMTYCVKYKNERTK